MEETHDIRLATLADTPRLMRFIDEHWRKNHIFACDEQLFAWQHEAKVPRGRLNFFLAEERATGAIDAALGFIPTAQFDADLGDDKDYWLAIWKRREGSLHPTLGYRLYLQLMDTLQPRTISAIGLSPVAIKLYKALGFVMGSVSHYFLASRRMAAPSIMQWGTFEPPVLHAPSRLALQPLDEAQLIQLAGKIEPGPWAPRKTVLYLLNRFVRHPIYRYVLLGVAQGDDIRCVLVLRRIEVEGAVCFRLVDVYGGEVEELGSIQSELLRFLNREGGEFVDCYNHGISSDVFLRLGLWPRGDDVIIPNYFEPFERRNIDLRFAYLSPEKRYVVFKGDADQDRPSTVRCG